MNNRGQEFNILGVMMGIIGGLFAFWMAGTMGSGIGMKIFTGLSTTVVCYFLSSYIANK